MSMSEEEQLRAKQAEYRERHESYMGRLRWFATQLDAAADDNPVARAVCDLHHFEETFDNLECADCLLYEDDYQLWPCDTIKAVAVALNVEVPDR